MGDEATVMEVYNLLLYNYVEDDDAMFRCCTSSQKTLSGETVNPALQHEDAIWANHVPRSAA